MNIKEKRDFLYKYDTEFYMKEVNFLDNLWEPVKGFYFNGEYRNKCVYHDVLISREGIHQIALNINRYFKKVKNIDNVIEGFKNNYDQFLNFLKFGDHIKYLVSNEYVRYRNEDIVCIGCSA